MRDDSLSLISQRFEAIDLHDSMLCGLTIRTDCDRSPHLPLAAIRLDIRLFRANPPNYWFEPAILEFLDCTYITSRVDLTELAGVGFQIAANECTMESALRTHIESNDFNQTESLQDYVQFDISLVHPAGEIAIFARDFVLRLTKEDEDGAV